MLTQMVSVGILFAGVSSINETVYEERPAEIYFRNDTRTFFGLIRFEHSKDNPYKHAKLVEKVMKNQEFRAQHEAHETDKI